MQKYTLTKEQARTFMVIKQGLLGGYRFIGKSGILDFIKQAGCIQFDPIDICGKNAELVLQSRVKGFKKQMLYDLLYEDRKLVDYFDKNLSIFLTSDWPAFSRMRNRLYDFYRSKEKVDQVCESVKEMIKERGPLASKDIDLNEKVNWFWSDTKLARATLETLYFRGELIVHHKKGTNKYYGLTKHYLPLEIIQANEPFSSDFEYVKWRVLRRIGGVGLLWNKASDAWLGFKNFKSNLRNEVFNNLLEANEIIELEVEGLKDPLYCLASDESILNEVLNKTPYSKRMELLAPLDSFLWDRKLIKALFDFDYKWEIYTPIIERKYGYYVLPLLYGNEFIGRVEVINQKREKRLLVQNVWLEDGVKLSEVLVEELEKCFSKFSDFNECIHPVSYDIDLKNIKKSNTI